MRSATYTYVFHDPEAINPNIGGGNIYIKDPDSINPNKGGDLSEYEESSRSPASDSFLGAPFVFNLGLRDAKGLGLGFRGLLPQIVANQIEKRWTMTWKMGVKRVIGPKC